MLSAARMFGLKVFAPIGLLMASVLSQYSDAQETLGLVKEKPADGQFVETDQGFMVPYKTVIPGTEIEFEMVPIPGGTFTLGSPDDEEGREDAEGPQKTIEVAPFWIGKYEVTWDEYKRYMELHDIFKGFESFQMRAVENIHGTDVITAPSNLYDPTFTYSAGEGPREPAATMTQFAAKHYTKWLSILCGDFYRLPSEAEWEYAARAGTDTAYFFGDDPDELEEYAWFEDNSDELRHDVGELKPNPWGLYDIYGNVAEWTLDAFTPEGYGFIEGDKAKSSDVIRWPEKEYPLVARGGSFEMTPAECRSAARLGSDDEAWKSDDPNVPKSPWWYTTYPGTGVGIRLVRPLNPPKTAEEKEAFWKARVEYVEWVADHRIDNEGRGARGVVDQKLPAAIIELRKKEAEDRQ